MVSTPGSVLPAGRYPAFLYSRWLRALPIPVDRTYDAAPPMARTKSSTSGLYPLIK